MFKTATKFTLALSLALCACDPATPLVHEDDAPARFRDEGGIVLNTNSDGEHTLWEVDLTGEWLNGVRVASVVDVGSMIPILVENIALTSNGMLTGTGSNGVSYSGEDFVDTVWTVEFGSAKTGVSATSYTRIDSVRILPGELLYRYQFLNVTDPNSDIGEAAPSCEIDNQGDFEAVLLPDFTVDPETGDFTQRDDTMFIGCLSGAVGKAGMLGYSTHAVSLSVAEAAVRFLRADYCGDGTSYTEPGVSLLYADSLGIEENGLLGDPEGAWEESPTEALWDDGGALCLHTTRLSGAQVSCGIPTCGHLANWSTYPEAMFWTKVP